MYGLARKVLFAMPPELSHEVALDWMGAAHRLGLLKLFASQSQKPVEVMGLNFANPVGMAAGLDKNGDYFNALGDLGFGFVEIGTVTPKAQSGNPQPRLFRLSEQNAIINRMGFNNKGVDHLLAQVKKRTYTGVLGINIGKNKTTPDTEALDDYLSCLRVVYPYADYVAVNISSPNTPGLRSLQFGESLSQLVAGVKVEQKRLADQHGRYVPIAVKIAPDMNDDEIRSVAATLQDHQIDAIIATNTTLSRQGVETSPYAAESGGLSGAPVRDMSTHVIKVLADYLEGSIPIIGVGGILSGDDAKAKFAAGAKLVQVYSGFIYRGPELVSECVNAYS